MAETKDSAAQEQKLVAGDRNRMWSDIKILGTVGPSFMLAPLQFKVPWFNSNTAHFKPDRDIPDLTGKVLLITGGNAGIGKSAIIEFAKHKPAKIFLAARSAEKAQNAIVEINNTVPDAPPVTHLPLDLSSLESVRKAAQIVLRDTQRLDILMLNAGVMALPFGKTAEGYEIQLGTNHVGHAALTKLLLPLLNQTTQSSSSSDVRIICLSSLGHNAAPPPGLILDNAGQEKLDPWQRYGVSKLANALYARALAKHYPNIKTAAIHPGIGVTDLYSAGGSANPMLALSLKLSNFILPTTKELAMTQLWAATAKEVESGTYYEPVGRKHGTSRFATDDALAEELWVWTEAELAKHGIS